MVLGSYKDFCFFVMHFTWIIHFSWTCWFEYLPIFIFCSTSHVQDLRTYCKSVYGLAALPSSDSLIRVWWDTLLTQVERERERGGSAYLESAVLFVFPCIPAYKMWNSSIVDTIAIKSDRWQVLLHLRDLCWWKNGGRWVQEKWSLPVFSRIDNRPCSDTKRVEGPCCISGLTVRYDLLLMTFCSTTRHIHLCCWHPLLWTLRQCLWHSIMYIGIVFMLVLNSRPAYWMNAQFMIYVIRRPWGVSENCFFLSGSLFSDLNNLLSCVTCDRVWKKKFSHLSVLCSFIFSFFCENVENVIQEKKK